MSSTSGGIIITVQGKGFNQILKDLQAAVKKLPNQIGITAVAFTKENFDKQGFQGDSGIDAWKPRNKYAPRNSRKILTDKGNLKRSIRKEVVGNSIKILVGGAAEKYADIHNTGGKIIQTPTSKQRMYFSYRSEAASSTQEKNYWAALSRARQLVINMPKRQFIGSSKQLDKRIGDMILNQLNKAVNS